MSNEDDEIREEEQEEISLSSRYLETNYSSPLCNSTSTLRTTYSPKSNLTKDFEDSSATLSVTPPHNDKPSIVREFSREFPKLARVISSYQSEKSSELLFKVVECSDCSLLRKQALKDERVVKKTAQLKTKKDELLQNTLILDKFYDVFPTPLTDRFIRKISFNENLIISVDPGCDIPINFGASDMELNPKNKYLFSEFSNRVGVFSLRIEEADGKLITYCNSKLSINESVAGTTIISLILDDLALLEERKTEWYFENERKIEKNLHVVMENDNYVAFLDHKDINKVTNRRGELNLKSSGDFLQDGGIYVLMRYLILKEFVGNFQFWTMDINGKIGLCKMDVGVKRNIVINNINYNTIRVKKELFRSNIKKEISKTYFLSNGYMVLHKWKGCSYYIHIDNKLSIPSKTGWNLTNNWMNDIILTSQFNDEKDHILTIVKTYLEEHPQIKTLLHDYLLFLLLLKPENVLEYTINYFLNMYRDY